MYYLFVIVYKDIMNLENMDAFIDNITIDQMGFETTTHDCFVYKKVIDGNVVYLLKQIYKMCAAVCDQKLLRIYLT